MLPLHWEIKKSTFVKSYKRYNLKIMQGVTKSTASIRQLYAPATDKLAAGRHLISCGKPD